MSKDRDKKESVQVAVRFRPLNDREKSIQNNDTENFYLSLKKDKSSVEISKYSGSTEHIYYFDSVFDETSSQEEIFNTLAKNNVEWVIQGYNSTIFAYGPTGTGKSFTMFGKEGYKDIELEGIIPRACRYIFELLSKKETVFSVKCTFVEIYLENLRDLFSTTKSDIRIRQGDTGTYIQGCLEKTAHSHVDILSHIQTGLKNRSIASTSLNSVSSRSHAVLTINIKQKFSDGTEINSKLNLIDLAGSENVGKSKVEGIALSQAQMINKSLSSLGNVINALTDKNRTHVPYRDSRLTFLLQDSLGGNSRTTLISTATLHWSVYSETLNTLEFAKRAKQIKNSPVINIKQSDMESSKLISELRAEIEELRGRYQETQLIVERIERYNEINSDEQAKLLLERIELLEKRLDSSEIEKKEIEAKYLDVMAIFKKQRKLAKIASLNLYKERMNVVRLESELESYKKFYQSIKKANPSIIGYIIRDFSVPVMKDIREDTFNIELDSPQ